jgi:hypothetical protein
MGCHLFVICTDREELQLRKDAEKEKARQVRWANSGNLMDDEVTKIAGSSAGLVAGWE